MKRREPPKKLTPQSSESKYLADLAPIITQLAVEGPAPLGVSSKVAPSVQPTSKSKKKKKKASQPEQSTALSKGRSFR